MLEETKGTRKLLIWVGRFEGTAIALLLSQAAPPRPQTFAFLGSAFRALYARVWEARVTRLTGEVFYAEVVLEGLAGAVTVDARPSDAIALALTVEAPIRVEETMLDSLQPNATSQTKSEAGVRRAVGEQGAKDTSEGAQEIAVEVMSGWEKR